MVEELLKLVVANYYSIWVCWGFLTCGHLSFSESRICQSGEEVVVEVVSCVLALCACLDYFRSACNSSYVKKFKHKQVKF